MKRTITNRIIVFSALVILYLLLTTFIPPDASISNRYDVRPSDLMLIRLAVALPLAVIWFLALYGFLSIYRYADSIRNHKDGKALMTISNGLGVLTFGLPLQSISVSVFNYFGRSQPQLEPTMTIISNYIALGIMLVGFYILNRGTWQLHKNLRSSDQDSPFKLWKASLGAFSALYIYLVLHNPARSNPTETVTRAAYYLPDWLIITTIVLPYIAVWYLGAQSAYNIYMYQKKTPGILYKQALKYISAGIVGIVGASILVRFLASQTTYLNTIGLRTILLLVYLLLITISIGYILVAAGARRLHKMENV